MPDNTERLQAIFNKANMNRNGIRYKLNRTLHDHVSFMENKIRKQLKTFTLLSICGGQRSNYMVNSYFQNAFASLTLEEKVLYFEKTIQFIKRFQEQKQNNQVTTEEVQLQQIKNKYGSQVRLIIAVNSGFNSWDEETISISGFKINSQKKINLDLRNYLLRKSKKKDVTCYVLEAIRSSKPQTIRFCFKRKQEEKFISMITELVDAAYYDFICKEAFNMEMGIMKKNQKTGKKMISLQQSSKGKINNNMPFESDRHFIDDEEQQHQKRGHQFSVSYELMRSKDQQEIQQDLKDIIDSQNAKHPVTYPSSTSVSQSKSKRIIGHEKHNYMNVFNVMLPSYNLNELDSLQNYEPVHSQSGKGLHIYRNKHNRHHFKMELSVHLPQQKVLMALYNIQMMKTWHPCVTEGQQKFKISSQNCSIFYQKNHKFSQWYRQRDFLYLKHVFYLKKSYYLVDKSFQNTNFIPFASIERGKINFCVTRISQKQKGCTIMMDIDMDHGGLLKQTYQQQLTIAYLKGFSNLEWYFSNKQHQHKLVTYFYHAWDIQETLVNNSDFINIENLKTQDFDNSEINNKSIDQSELYFSVDDLDKDSPDDATSQHEIQQKQIIEQEEHMKQTWTLPSKRQLNENGHIIVPQKYIKRRHVLEPLPSNPTVRVQRKFDHYILQDNWKHMQTGGLEIINQKKIQAQNNVFGFILKKLKENIFSGKGLTNISLPVQIFNCDSNLSRICRGFTLAPDFLEKASKVKDPIERMKFTMLFGISSSLFFLDAQKPFNPILGETYQGTIDGCPIYAQQISHHPPISCFYMVGRGYKIYGAIEAKVNLHLNSADGVNEGFYNVEYDDGQKITFTGPAGQVSNTTMGGNRQFNFLGKGCYYDVSNRLYSEIKFQQETGLFSKSKWKYRDQVEAQIVRVKQSFISQAAQKIKQNKSPSSKQIEERFSKMSGRWLFQILWDDRTAYKPDDNLPFEMRNYQYALPSDCFYRQDIYYRIMDDLARSQIEKQRLEVLQRGDRKHRQKYHKPHH